MVEAKQLLNAVLIYSYVPLDLDWLVWFGLGLLQSNRSNTRACMGLLVYPIFLLGWNDNEWYFVDSLLNLADLPHRLSNRSLISAVLTDEVCCYDLHWRPHRFHKGQEQGFPNRCLVCWTRIGGTDVVDCHHKDVYRNLRKSGDWINWTCLKTGTCYAWGDVGW